jgi:hypothetical protein
MSQKKIVVTVDLSGETQVEAIGHHGGTCVKATAPLTKTLVGGAPVSSVKKPEFFQGDIAPRIQQSE